MMMMMMTTMMMIPKIIYQNLKFQDPIFPVLRVTAPLSRNNSNRSGTAVWGVALRSLDCWDSVFESHWGHGCSSVVLIVLCVVWVTASRTSRLLVQRSPTARVCKCMLSMNIIHEVVQAWFGLLCYTRQKKTSEGHNTSIPYQVPSLVLNIINKTRVKQQVMVLFTLPSLLCSSHVSLASQKQLCRQQPTAEINNAPFTRWQHVYLSLCNDSSAKGLQKHFLHGQEGFFATARMVEVNKISVFLSTSY